MPRQQRIPSYRLHKPSGLAVVTLAGEDHYLGTHGTPESRESYDRKVAEWLAGGRMQPRELAACPTVAEVLDAYWVHAQAYYVKDGQPTSQQDRIERSLDAVRTIYGSTPAREFGPQRLKAVRASLVEASLCRRQVNQRVDCIRLAWKWAVAEELVPPDAHHALMAVERLRKGRTEAPDHPPVKPADPAAVEGALLKLPPVLASVVRFQLLTAARPGEALQLRACDLDRSGPVWLYRPRTWKTQHRDEQKRPRVLFVGPRCQAEIGEWLELAARRGPESHVFCPAVSMRLFREQQRRDRETPVQPSQQRRKKPKAQLLKQPGESYATQTYGHAVKRACKLAKVAHWHPHQLRHNAATLLAEQFGWETARIVLGHADVDMTREYAEEDIRRACAAMAKAG